MPSSSARLAQTLLLTVPLRFRAQSATSTINVAACQPLLRPPPRAAFSVTARRRWPPTGSDTPLSNGRYGTANEPPAHLGGGKAIPSTEPKEGVQKDLKKDEKTAPQDRIQGKKKREKKVNKGAKNEDALEPDQDDKIATSSPDPVEFQPSSSDPEAVTLDAAAISGSADPKSSPSALTSILQMEPPASSDSTEKLSDPEASHEPPSDLEDNPPHLEPPPYVHHFDTYSLVKDLSTPPPETASKDPSQPFTQEQSVIIMKAVRSLLAQNMDRARDGLLSKSDFELSTHQFRAAAAELRTEVHQRRSAGTERMRAERTQLSHEVEILSQRLGQELLGLKDELKGMLDDRKMAARMERREVENRIQELNYKITVRLGSEMRNEIEGLRFILTRRAVLVLTGLVIVALASLRVSTYRRAQEEKEAKKREELVEKLRGGDSGTGHGVAGGLAGGAREKERLPAGGDATSQEMARRIEKGDNPGLISLG